MTLVIMQPYLFPYIGYFQLMKAADEFVIYDNIQFTKKGWINRNRILSNGKDEYLTLPLKKGSDYLNVDERSLAETWVADRKKILNKIEGAYKKAPFFNTAFPVVEAAILSEETILFRFILNSIKLVNEYLEIKTPLIISSTIPIDHSLKSERKVIEICKERRADTYLNPIGGVTLYNKMHFEHVGIELHFHKTDIIAYKQFSNDFIPFLSIIDVMMFNSRNEVIDMLAMYSIQ